MEPVGISALRIVLQQQASRAEVRLEKVQKKLQSVEKMLKSYYEASIGCRKCGFLTECWKCCIVYNPEDYPTRCVECQDSDLCPNCTRYLLCQHCNNEVCKKCFPQHQETCSEIDRSEDSESSEDSG